MTVTANLQITDLENNQGSPEVTVNDAHDIMDAAIAGVLVHNMSSDADYTLLTTGTAPYEWQNAVIEITDTTSPQTLTATRNIIIPDYPKAYDIINSTGQSIVLASGTTSPVTGITIATGKAARLYYDGSSVRRITADA